MNTRLSRQFLRVTLPLIACLLAAAAARADDPPRMDLNLAFSLDGGKTYSSDFPFLPAPGTLKVRVTWSNPRPPNETEVYTTALYSEQADFASANVGKQTWSGFPAWYQRPRVYWAGPKATSFVYDLDLRARPADTIGYDNVWDAKANRRANGPLPACEALANGTWKFTVRVGYPLKHTPPKKQVEGTADFFVTIGQTAPATAKAAPAAAPAAPKAAFDETPPELGRGDAEWSIAEAESIGTAPKAPTQQGDVLLLPAKQELRWIVSNAAPGSVYVGIVLSSEAGRMFTPGTVYVDGEPVRFLSTRTPGRMGSSWVAEYLAETPLPVRAGSEVRVVAPQAAPVTVGRLAFYRTAPERGPIDVRHTPEPAAEDTLRITTALQVGPERDRAGTATFAVENVLTHPLKAVVRARVLDHFQQIVTQFSNSVVLAPRVPFEQTLSFTWGASERYRLAVDVDTNDGHHAAGVAEAAADALEPMRGKVWLSGAWEFTGLGDAIHLAPPAEDAKWEPVHVPGRSPNSVRNGEHCGWFRRTFTVPDWLPG